MARNATGLTEALKRIPQLREEFWREVRVPGDGEEFNQSLERAGRVADFLEFAELMCTRCARPATNHAAAIFARNIKLPTAKRCATMRNSRMSSPGNIRAMAGQRSPNYTENLASRPSANTEKL